MGLRNMGPPAVLGASAVGPATPFGARLATNAAHGGFCISLLDWLTSGPSVRAHREAPLIRIIVIAALVLIVASLGTALYYLYRDRGRGTRMVRALTLRVALSASLLVFLVISYKLGWIGDAGLR
jgi:Protein of unknown function (DUF2909)